MALEIGARGLDDDTHPHSDAITVVERWWRPDFDHLAHEVTVTDPKYYTRPFTFDRVFEHMAPGQKLIEYACNENNRDLPRLGFGPTSRRSTTSLAP